MNKAQLVEAIADKLGGRQQAADAVDAVLDAIVRAVVAGERVSVTGFGSFEKVDRPARYARNPQTGERVRVKKTSVPRFRAGQGFKDLVSGSKKLPRGGEVAVKKAPKGSLTGGASADGQEGRGEEGHAPRRRRRRRPRRKKTDGEEDRPRRRRRRRRRPRRRPRPRRPRQEDRREEDHGQEGRRRRRPPPRRRRPRRRRPARPPPRRPPPAGSSRRAGATHAPGRAPSGSPARGAFRRAAGRPACSAASAGAQRSEGLQRHQGDPRPSPSPSTSIRTRCPGRSSRSPPASKAGGVEGHRGAVVEQHAAGAGLGVVRVRGRLHARQPSGAAVSSRAGRSAVRGPTPRASAARRSVAGVHVLAHAVHAGERDFHRARGPVPGPGAAPKAGRNSTARARPEQRRADSRGIREKSAGEIRRRRRAPAPIPRAAAPGRSAFSAATARRGRGARTAARPCASAALSPAAGASGTIRAPSAASSAPASGVVRDDRHIRAPPGRPAPRHGVLGEGQGEPGRAARRPRRPRACSWPAPGASAAPPGSTQRRSVRPSPVSSHPGPFVARCSARQRPHGRCRWHGAYGVLDRPGGLGRHLCGRRSARPGPGP